MYENEIERGVNTECDLDFTEMLLNTLFRNSSTHKKVRIRYNKFTGLYHLFYEKGDMGEEDISSVVRRYIKYSLGMSEEGYPLKYKS